MDYKTGTVHASASTAEEAFSAAYPAKHLFQLQLYANLYNIWSDKENRPISTVVYDVGNILKDGNARSEGGIVVPRIGKDRLISHLSLTDAHGVNFNTRFMDQLRMTIREILDPSVPFHQTEDEQNCRYCRMKGICG